jgi:hypothetical protein
MKYLLMLAILTAAICGLSSCASTGTTTASGDPVPGETKSMEESRLQPGAGTGPNASVKW